MKCPVCANEGTVIYDDGKAVVIAPSHAVKAGHIRVAPKEHVQIISQVPDELVEHLFTLAQRIAVASGGAYNILASNRGHKEAHFALDVIPREEGDGLSFNWQQKQIDPAQLGEIADVLSKMPVSLEKAKKKEVVVEKAPEKIEEKKEEINYMLEQLKRYP